MMLQINEIGFENLPNVYFKEIIKTQDQQHDILTVHLQLYDHEESKSWSKSEIITDDLKIECKVEIDGRGSQVFTQDYMIGKNTYLFIFKVSKAARSVSLMAKSLIDLRNPSEFDFDDISFGEPVLRGPTSIEKIKTAGSYVSKAYAYVKNDGNLNYGPVHSHTSGLMQGSRHRSTSHDSLRKSAAYTIKVKNVDKKNYMPSEQYQSAINVTNIYKNAIAEEAKQTENYVSIVFMMSEMLLSLQDDTSVKLYNINRNLFMNLKNKITINQINLKRYSVRSRKIYNNLLVPIGEDSEVPKNEESILVSTNLSSAVSYRNSTNFSVIENLKTENNSALSELKMLTSLQGVDIYEFKDFEAIKNNNVKYKYNVVLDYSVNIKNIIKSKINQLERSISDLKNINTEISMGKKFKDSRLREDYIIQIHKRYGFNLKYVNSVINYDKETSSPSTNTPWISIPTKCKELIEFLTDEQSELPDLIFTLINPLGMTRESIGYAIDLLQNVISQAKQIYDLEEKKISIFASGRATRYQPNNTNIIKIEVPGVLKIFKPELSAEFLNIPNTGVISKDTYNQRVNQEKQKFFKNTVSTGGRGNYQSEDAEETSGITDYSNAFAFLTPTSIKIGKDKKDLSKPKNSIFDNKFFNKVTNVKNRQKRFSKRSKNIQKIEKLNILVKGDSRNYFGNSMAFTNTVEGGADPLKKGTQISEDDLSTLNSIETIANDSDKKMNVSSFLPSSKEFRKTSDKKISKLPPSIKALMLSDRSEVVNFPLAMGDFDPLRNSQTRESIKQNFLNIRKVEYLSGFKMDGKIPLISSPIWKDLDEETTNNPDDLYCRTVSYEDKEFGIEDDGVFSLQNIFMIKG